MIRTTAKYTGIAVGGLLAAVVVSLLVGFWFLTRGPVPVNAAAPVIRAGFADAFAPLRIEFIDPTLVWSGENRAFQFRVDQVEIFDAEDTLVADVPRAEIGISADGLMRGLIAPSRIEFIGATALLIRRRDGGLQLGLSTPGTEDRARPPNEDEPAPLGIVQSILDLLLEPPNRGTRAGYLTEFVIRDSTLRYFDAPSNSFWRAPDGYLAFGRGDEGLSLRLDADMEVGGRDWALDIGGVFDPVEGRGSLSGEFADFNPSHIAAAVPSLTSLRGIDLPIRGSVDLDFTSAGEVLSADLSVIVGSGVFGLPGFFDEPIPVDSAAFVGAFRPKDKAAEIRHLTFQAGENRASISGQVGIETAEGDPWLPTAFNLNVVAEDLSIFVTSLQDSPIVYERAELRGRIDEPARTIAITSFDGETGGGEVHFAGHVTDASGEVAAYAQGTAQNIPATEVLAYWPLGRALGARDWISLNIRDGLLRDMDFEIDAPPGTFGQERIPNEVLEVNFTFEDMESTFISTLPVMTEGRGHATLFADQFDLTLEHGRIGDILIHQGHMLVDEMQVRGTTGVFEVEAEGPIDQVLDILDTEPFDYPSRYGFDPASISGTGRGTVRVALPMLSRPPPERIDYAAQAVVEGFAMPEAAPSIDVTDGTLNLDLARTGLRADGQIALNGVPVDFTWHETFEDERMPSRFSVAGTLSDSDRIRLGLDFGAAVAGPVDVEIATRGQGRDLREVDIRADLNEATVLIPNTDWIKPAGEIGAARLRLGLPEAGGLEVHDLLFAGDRALIRGGFALSASGRLETAALERIRLDGLIDVALNAARDENNALTIEVNGEYFNAAPFMQEFTRAEDQGPGLPFVIQGGVTRLTMLEDVTVGDVELYMFNDGERILEMDLAGGFEDGGSVRANMIPRTDGSRDFIVTTSNAGALMKGLVGFDYISGGNLVLDVVVRDQAAPAEGGNIAQGSAEEGAPDVPDELEAGHTRGLLTVDQFRVVDAPVLAQLLSLGSLQGLADTLNGDGIAFQSLELPFYADGGVIGFESGRAHGSALGITLDGTIDRDRGLTDLTGTLVPAYDINSFLGNVPVFGELFVSREGEGLIAFTYGILGPTENPQVYVNPLAALTPGLLRRIFSGNPPETPAPTRPETQPETSAPAEPDAGSSEPAETP